MNDDTTHAARERSADASGGERPACPRCGKQPEDYPTNPGPCCNPQCKGAWGTGCYHCHHPRFAERRAVSQEDTPSGGGPPEGYLDEIDDDDELDDTGKWRAFVFAWGIERRRCSDLREDMDKKLRGIGTAPRVGPELSREDFTDRWLDVADALRGVTQTRLDALHVLRKHLNGTPTSTEFFQALDDIATIIAGAAPPVGPDLADYVPCQACGWDKPRAPDKHEEPPLVRESLDAPEKSELALRREEIDHGQTIDERDEARARVVELEAKLSAPVGGGGDLAALYAEARQLLQGFVDGGEERLDAHEWLCRTEGLPPPQTAEKPKPFDYPAMPADTYEASLMRKGAGAPPQGATPEWTLECPRCGHTAARNPTCEGDRLVCGCAGFVSDDGEQEPYAIFDDEFGASPPGEPDPAALQESLQWVEDWLDNHGTADVLSYWNEVRPYFRRPQAPPVLPEGARVHDLKVWPDFYKHLESGEKTFELRKDDRGFRAGHWLQLREWSKRDGYSGREMLREVTYLAAGNWLAPDHVCMSLGPPVRSRQGEATP